MTIGKLFLYMYVPWIVSRTLTFIDGIFSGKIDMRVWRETDPGFLVEHEMISI